MSTEVQHLDSISAFYEKGDFMDELMMDRELDLIKRYPTEGKSALEVGCGSGSCTERLIKIFPDLEVIEPSPNNIELLHSRLPEVVCHASLLEDLDLGRKFDYVFFLNVLEHVVDPVQSLRHLEKLVRHEGLIFISVPNCMSLNRRAGYKMGLLQDYEQLAPKDIEVGHRRLYTVDRLNAHCEQAGLKVTAIKGIYLKPLSESQMTSLGQPAIRAFLEIGEDIPHYCASLFAVATKKDF